MYICKRNLFYLNYLKSSYFLRKPKTSSNSICYLKFLKKKSNKCVAFSECINSFQKYKISVVKKSAISIEIPKLNFKFQLISIHQLHCTLHSCQIARAATVDWIGAFLKCKPSYLMRGIKSVRRKMMIAWIYPKIAKSASVILVEEVASLIKEIRQCQECLLFW